MVLYHNTLHRSTADGREYECLSCGGRTTSETPLSACPTCSGPLQNLAVPRE